MRKMVKTLDPSWIGYSLMELNTQSHHREKIFNLITLLAISMEECLVNNKILYCIVQLTDT